MSVPLIEFDRATVTHGSRVALDAITLSIGAGEHVAILGPNGSGKSTLIKTITREAYPRYREGSPPVRILGSENWNIFDLLPLLGVVSNDFLGRCHWSVTGRELILSGFFASVGIWPHHRVTPEMESAARAIMARLEITHLAERNIHEMSSGEARRCLIGRALVHNPRAILLDEPSTSLDLAAAAELRNAMRRLAHSGTGIILVTHHLPDIIPEIKRVILLRQGRVFADGPKELILTPEKLSALFGAPVELEKHGGYYHARRAAGPPAED
jgi:iron complex transport system ATP-binding protein